MANLLGQMRRGLVINQGPGCIIDFRTEEGATISIIHPGLEFWEQEAPLVPNDPSRITEERLQKILIEKLRTRYRDEEAEIYINYFRLPPACSKEDAENANSQVLGGIRFPNYLKCPNCNTLKHTDDWADAGPGKPEKVCPCLSRRENGKVSFVVPSRFLVSCPDGHISDFPWTTYLNYISQYSGPCNHEVFKLTQSSDSGLGGLILSCNDRDCNARGSMQNIFSRDLWNEIDITCSGERPWLGQAGQEECTHKPKTILKGAANGYFPVYESVISIPPVQDSFLERNGIKVHNMREQMTLDQAKDHIRNNALINGFDADEAIKRYEAIDRYASGGFREPLREEFVRITDTDDEWDEEDSDYDDFIKENMPVPNELSSLIEHLVKIE